MRHISYMSKRWGGKPMKKLKTLMIMLVVIITALTFGNISKAAENDQGRYCENGLYYEYNQSTDDYILVDADPQLEAVIIPDTVAGKHVERMGYSVFQDNTRLKKVMFNKYISVIKTNTFANCTALEDVVLLDNINVVEEYAFLNCTSLKKMTFADGIYCIEKCAFYNAGLEKIQFANDYISIESNAFLKCKNLKSVAFIGVSEIGSKAFGDCTVLGKVTFKKVSSEARIASDAFENTKWVKAYQRKHKAIVTKGVLINGYYMKGNVTLNGKKIHGITALAFAGNQKIKKVKLKDIEAIGEKAFVRSSVTEVSLIGGKILGHNLFNNCRRLRKISVSGIKTIPENTFVSIPALKKLILGKEVTKIESDAITNCEKLHILRFKTRKAMDWHPYEYGNKDVFKGCPKIKHVYMNRPKWERKNPSADWLA